MKNNMGIRYLSSFKESYIEYGTKELSVLLRKETIEISRLMNRLEIIDRKLKELRDTDKG